MVMVTHRHQLHHNCDDQSPSTYVRSSLSPLKPLSSSSLRPHSLNLCSSQSSFLLLTSLSSSQYTLYNHRIYSLAFKVIIRVWDQLNGLRIRQPHSLNLCSSQSSLSLFIVNITIHHHYFIIIAKTTFPLQCWEVCGLLQKRILAFKE